MVQHISPYLAASPILNPVANNATGKTSNATSSTSGTSGTSNTDIGSTFLSLLVEELKNQDPTAPVDSTAMVGQMISLNQLDQLISINQQVGGQTGSLSGAVARPSGSPQSQGTPSFDSSKTSSATAMPLSPMTPSAQQVFPY